MTGTTSWTQGQNEIDAVYGEVALSAPDQCPLVGYPTVQSFAEVRIKVDGVLVAGVGAFGGSGSSQTLALNSGYVFEPGASTGRTLIAEVNDYCEGDHHFTIKSLKVDVVAIH
jgi:hypothetical protein